jgi:hypothetical protein
MSFVQPDAETSTGTEFVLFLYSPAPGSFCPSAESRRRRTTCSSSVAKPASTMSFTRYEPIASTVKLPGFFAVDEPENVAVDPAGL